MIMVMLWTGFAAAVLWLGLHLLDEWLMRSRLPQGSKLPPMAPVTSIRGHVELLDHDFHRKKCIEWVKKYGAVIRLKVNCLNIIVLNDFETIKKFFNTTELLYRSPVFLPYRDTCKGLGAMHSGAWSANRKFCMSLLRDSGFAKTAMEDHMMKEFNRLSESIGKTNGKPLDVSDYIVPCALNNIVSFFYGAQLTHDHPARHELLQLMKGVGPALFTGPQNQFLPWSMRRLLSWIPYTRNYGLANVLAKLDSFNMKQIEEYKAQMYGDEDKDFIMAYTKKIEESKRESNELFKDDYLVGHINLFVAAGTLGPTKIMLWQLLNFARYADTVQARVQREIDGVVGRERQPTWEDRKHMPYTMACVCEVHRWKTAQPLGPSRLCAQDVVIGDFFIPKGTTIVPNFWAVHNDPTLWQEPWTFRPERYLSEDGKMMKLKPEYLIPFSIGRRNCVGETFVTMEVFLMVTFLLQKYRIVTERPIEDDIDSPDFDLSPYSPIRLRFLPRFTDIA